LLLEKKFLGERYAVMLRNKQLRDGYGQLLSSDRVRGIGEEVSPGMRDLARQRLAELGLESDKSYALDGAGNFRFSPHIRHDSDGKDWLALQVTDEVSSGYGELHLSTWHGHETLQSEVIPFGESDIHITVAYLLLDALLSDNPSHLEDLHRAYPLTEVPR
jgi:hypothetical protein